MACESLWRLSLDEVILLLILLLPHDLPPPTSVLAPPLSHQFIKLWLPTGPCISSGLTPSSHVHCSSRSQLKWKRLFLDTLSLILYLAPVYLFHCTYHKLQCLSSCLLVFSLFWNVGSRKAKTMLGLAHCEYLIDICGKRYWREREGGKKGRSRKE